MNWPAVIQAGSRRCYERWPPGYRFESSPPVKAEQLATAKFHKSSSRAGRLRSASLDHLVSYLAGNGGQRPSHLPRGHCGHSADRGGHADRGDRPAVRIENGDADGADAVLAFARVAGVAVLAYLLQLCKQDRLGGDRAGGLGRQRLARGEGGKFFPGDAGQDLPPPRLFGGPEPPGGPPRPPP